MGGANERNSASTGLQGQVAGVQSATRSLVASDGARLHLYEWRPQGLVRGVVEIAHGMGEHALRYEEVASALCVAGYAVYAPDLRGHGRTAASDLLGDMGEDGWNRCVQDLRELNDLVAAEHPDVPRILLGHSMGSLLAQQYLCEHGESISGAVLSGSTAGGGFMLRLSGLAARLERWRLGQRADSALLGRLLFGNSNRDFRPARTDFDWLSRDQKEVDKYVADPLCGFVLRVQSLIDMFHALRLMRRVGNIARIPKKLPIYIFSGEKDPVHRKLKGLEKLLGRYQKAGLKRVSHRFYPGGRHEMFNETSRAEVVKDLLSWLDTID